MGAVATVIVLALVSVAIWLSNALHPKQEASPVPSRPTTAQQNDLQAKATAEDTLTHYEQVIAQTADKVAALQPGLTWRWNRDSTTLSCGGGLADTQGVQILTRHALFDGPILDAVWPAALDVVRQRASELGAGELYVYVDEPANHDIALTTASGVEVRFGTKVAATLSARSDCHLPAADHGHQP